MVALPTCRHRQRAAGSGCTRGALQGLGLECSTGGSLLPLSAARSPCASSPPRWCVDTGCSCPPRDCTRAARRAGRRPPMAPPPDRAPTPRCCCRAPRPTASAPTRSLHKRGWAGPRPGPGQVCEWLPALRRLAWHCDNHQHGSALARGYSALHPALPDPPSNRSTRPPARYDAHSRTLLAADRRPMKPAAPIPTLSSQGSRIDLMVVQVLAAAL